ncbi:MAG: hypothetical protein J3K34DRAFT_451727 [Monoraphidium minutum]|nr:MAG: hypothetical protein J3K34DRAFT_451727 [Monoraphidium minutum]
MSLYIHSDLRGFRPNDTTYVFFGRRGSGKTTIRLQMEEAYRKYNLQAIHEGRSKGHFVVDIARPGHMTACLSTFQEVISASPDNWDAAFQDNWTSTDMADCILCYAATKLVAQAVGGGPESKAMVEAMRADPRLAHQFLLLAHLYARTDVWALAWLRVALLRPTYTPAQITVAVAGGLTAALAGAAAAREPAVADALAAPIEAAWDYAESAIPPLRTHPKLVMAGLSTLGLAGVWAYRRSIVATSYGRAAQLQAGVRVNRPQPVGVLASLLDSLFSRQDTAGVIATLCIGRSVHQKLELLQRLVVGLGYETLTVFGDCFDEVTLLDPVRFPGAIKAFAREICRNDLLSFGRLHFFFPDSRLGLDLNTDKTLKEARFDRHFVRDLTWSRHQLEELAERRFRAAQDALKAEAAAAGRPFPGDGPDGDAGAVAISTSFADLFKKVRGEDFSSYLSKLSTPRELLIMMTEMFARIEAHPEGGLTAQDMELAVIRALEQSV